MSNVKKGLALVIGNADYQHYTKLPSCHKDGNDMKAKLESLNFDILYYSDTTRSTMLDAITEFIKLADLYSVLLVYYAGHGVQIDGENYFVPVDSKYVNVKALFIASSVVGIKTITDYMRNHEDKTNILILDACRCSLPFSRAIVGTGLAEMSAGHGTIIAFATAPYTEAFGSTSPTGNGVYTKRLLEHIDHPNIRIEDMFKLVRKDVVADTNGMQIPWENTSLNSDFCFNIMSQDDINEQIYQCVRNHYSAEILILLSKHFGYTVSDIMRIYQRQKSEKPGGIYFSDETAFEQFILEHILELKFRFVNYRWVYNDVPVLMGDFQHDYKATLRN